MCVRACKQGVAHAGETLGKAYRNLSTLLTSAEQFCLSLKKGQGTGSALKKSCDLNKLREISFFNLVFFVRLVH